MFNHSRSIPQKRIRPAAVGLFLLSATVFCSGAFHALGVCNEPQSDKHFKADWATRLESKGLSPAEFTDCVAAMLQQEKKIQVKVAGPLELRVAKVGDKGELTLFLDNAWKACGGEPGSRKSVVELYYKSVSDLSVLEKQAQDIKLTDVVPLIRSKEYFGNLDTKSTTAQKAFHVPFVSDLFLLYAVDTPTSIAVMTPSKVESLKLDPATLRSTAVQNLLKKIPELSVTLGKEDVGMIKAGGDYEISLLLYDKFWTDTQKRLGGRLIVAVPTRSVVLFVKEGNAAGLELVRKIAADSFANMDHPVSDKLLIFDGKWQEYK